MLYALHLYSEVCQLFPNKTGKHKTKNNYKSSGVELHVTKNGLFNPVTYLTTVCN